MTALRAKSFKTAILAGVRLPATFGARPAFITKCNVTRKKRPMFSRLSDGDVFRYAKTILCLAAVALIFTGLAQAQMKPSQIDFTAVRPSLAAHSEIPAGAQSVVSATLGKSDEAYRAKSSGQGYATENPANRLAAQYADDGVKIRFQNADLGFEFQGWGYGKVDDKRDHAAVAPSVDANRVEYRRGDLTEWYINGPLGIEQGFTISQAPSAVASPDSQREALDISLYLRGNLSASVEPGRHALTLRDQSGVETLHYGPLLAYDASGRELESWMEAQDGSLRLRVNTAGAHYPIIVDPWVQSAKLSNSAGGVGESFGRSVAVSGNTVVVGAPYATINGHAEQGAAYVFVEPANGWATTGTYNAELIDSSGVAGDSFGASVGISGNTIVVGEPCSFPSCTGQGAAYVYVQSTWSGTVPYSAKLTESTGAAGDEFGSYVAISGNTIVVAAAAANTYLGAVYVFVEPTWSGSLTSNIELTDTGGAAGDYFGYSVGINETADTIVVGKALATVGNNMNQGAAYVFMMPSGGWAPPTKTPAFAAELTASAGAAGDEFGTSVAISGNTVVVGAIGVKVGLSTAEGAAYVFVEPTTAGGWADKPSENQTAELTLTSGASSTSLGNSVGISGNIVIAGAQGVSIGANSATGATFVFVEPTTAGGWADAPSENPTAELTATVGESEAFLGYSVGIDGNTVVAGAQGVSFGSPLVQGAAYVFTQPAGPGAYAQYSPTQVNFGDVVLNAPATQTVNVMNTGSQPLIIQLVTPSADGTIFSVTQYVCNGSVSSPPVYPLTISPNATCTFTVQFDPTAPGADNVQLGFEDNAGVGQSNVFSTQSGSNFLQSLPLSGTGDTTIAIFSAGAIGLTSAPVGTSASPQQLTLQNEGGAAMTVSLITVTTNGVYSNQFFISNASCGLSSLPQTTYPAYTMSGFSVVAGDKCTFTLGAIPEVMGAITGQIAFAETAGSSNICATGSLATCMTGSNGFLAETIPLTGTGTGTPGISVGAQSESFPNQPVGVKATAPIINVSNTGNVPLYFATIGIEGPNQADFGETTTCSTSTPLPPAGINVCMITVTFTPSTAAQESATLFITNSAQNANIPLTGNGVAPTASATPATLAFGLQLDTQAVVGVAGTPMAVTLKNTGATLALTPITPTITAGANTNASDFSLSPAGTCGATLAPNSTCTINVTFAPTSVIPSSSTGGVSESATLSIADNASPEPQTVALSGIGVPFTFVGTPPSAATILDGQPDSFTIDVTVGPGSGTLTFACSGLTVSGVAVVGAACTFNPSSIMQTGATQTAVPVMVTITTTAGVFPERGPKLPLNGLRRWLPLSSIAMMLLLGLWMSLAAAQKRRAIAGWAFLALVLLCGGWMAACNSSGSGGSSPPATQKGQDTFTITGKLGNVTESINAVLNVM